MKNRILQFAGLSLLTATVALADSISPSSFSAVLNVGESVTIKKTVTVSSGPATTSKVDVYFLADTTGSMGSYINSVRTNAINIMNSVAGLGDVAFAVGSYKDFPKSPYGGGSDFPYRLDSAVTTNTALAQAAINTWSASGGSDGPESQFAALERLSDSQAAAVGWRPGSEKIVIWFGDASAHDSASEPAYPGPTKAEVIADLTAAGIAVEAINVYGVGTGIDTASQASSIASATGGHVYSNINSGAIASVIQSAITTAVSSYSKVGLDLTEAPAGVTVTAVPSSYVGAYDRSIERSFDFDVTFTGDTVGAYSFNIYGTVDGGRVATESDRIVVKDKPHGVPDSSASLALLGLSLGALCFMRRRAA